MSKFIIGDESLLEDLRDRYNAFKKHKKFDCCPVFAVCAAVLVTLLIIAAVIIVIKFCVKHHRYDEFLFEDEYDENGEHEDEEDDDEEDEE